MTLCSGARNTLFPYFFFLSFFHVERMFWTIVIGITARMWQLAIPTEAFQPGNCLPPLHRPPSRGGLLPPKLAGWVPTPLGRDTFKAPSRQHRKGFCRILQGACLPPGASCAVAPPGPRLRPRPDRPWGEGRPHFRWKWT